MKNGPKKRHTQHRQLRDDAGISPYDVKVKYTMAKDAMEHKMNHAK